jgi:hypothetical protein
MLKEIQEFEQKFEEMKIASSNLDRVVEKAMKDASTDELYELTDLLPKKYRGLRRIYEEIITREDKKV